MPKRSPRIISKAVGERAAKKRTEIANPPASPILFVPKPKTRIDEVYALIEEASNLCFTDEDGRPWIERDNIEDKGDGIYVVRFRCPQEALYTRVSLNRLVEKVCKELKSEVRYFCSLREIQYTLFVKQRFYECAWIIKEGELDGEVDWEDNNCESCIDTQEEIEGELTDESTAEEVDERMEECLENFV